ncbi:hypothetical protein L3Y34_002173 [Caenorhabditis briggsae]|uniref:Uncharacterized protein n=1 Tax=Caenorhabditis briggsae TaxID=6238 RepID=A0AAE9DE14_CAEBR|nr:hypothetical protein L3Y34_002173 [Caenorhabditis briggsae]
MPLSTTHTHYNLFQRAYERLGKYSVSPSAPSTSSQSSQESTSDVIPQTFGNMTTEGHMWYYQQPSHF